MNYVLKSILAIGALLVTVGCTTSAQFVVPEDTELYIYNRPDPVKMTAGGKVSTRPYGWNAMGIAPERGIPYRLEKNGEIIKEGNLRAVFRPASIFWPPYAVIYWPVGLNPNITYDLVNEKQE